ncbi:hypothetical protein [Streptomyces sp. NPDC049879]|uniref:hypothetical protein n=1 Tax=Streptomyces sp. NPDC049879 TaxID=3365598 RepID=UPI0037B722E2
MKKCRKCGADRRRWPRSCPRCGPSATRDAAEVGADMAAPAVISVVWSGVASFFRAMLRWLN